MMFKTHIAFAFLVGLLLIDFFNISSLYYFLLFVIIGAAIPDIDIEKSTVGRRIRPFSDIIKFFFGHRGFIHSIWLPLILLFILWYFGYFLIGMAFLVGYLSHLLIDGFTKEGINFLTPLKLRLKGYVKTGSFLDYFLFILFLILIFLKIKVIL